RSQLADGRPASKNTSPLASRRECSGRAAESRVSRYAVCCTGSRSGPRTRARWMPGRALGTTAVARQVARAQAGTARTGTAAGEGGAAAGGLMLAGVPVGPADPAGWAGAAPAAVLVPGGRLPGSLVAVQAVASSTEPAANAVRRVRTAGR